MGITYQEEFISYARHEVEPLAELEWEESGHPDCTLVIDWAAYFKMEEEGKIKFFTARAEGKLVGYFVVIIGSTLTTMGELVAAYDSVYVHKDYRKSTVGKRMFDYVEKCIKEDGISRAVASSSSKNPIGNFLTRLGYNEIETKYEKVL